MRQFAVSVPEGLLAHPSQVAAAIARTIGYPVVLKAQASALSYKSLNPAAAVDSAWEKMNADPARALPDLLLDEILVEKVGIGR